MGVKILPADKSFADCVKEAHDHTCAKCGIKIEGGMELSHIYTRSYRCIRWVKENALPKCNGCHRAWHDNPKEAYKWFQEKYGAAVLDKLILMKQQARKIYKNEEADITAHYREQLKIIKEKRSNGKTGYIDFDSVL